MDAAQHADQRQSISWNFSLKNPAKTQLKIMLICSTGNTIIIIWNKRIFLMLYTYKSLRVNNLRSVYLQNIMLKNSLSQNLLPFNANIQKGILIKFGSHLCNQAVLGLRPSNQLICLMLFITRPISKENSIVNKCIFTIRFILQCKLSDLV